MLHGQLGCHRTRDERIVVDRREGATFTVRSAEVDEVVCLGNVGGDQLSHIVSYDRAECELPVADGQRIGTTQLYCTTEAVNGRRGAHVVAHAQSALRRQEDVHLEVARIIGVLSKEK